jgi:hypothetical protein
VTVIGFAGAPMLHVNVAPPSPDAVNNELPQLFCTETPGAPEWFSVSLLQWLTTPTCSRLLFV